MVSIGSCDHCGEFCSEVGARACEEFAFQNGWVPTSVRDRHRRLVEARYDCAGEERHLGPRHDRWGRPLTRCLHCRQGSSLAYEDLGIPDISHDDCPTCLLTLAGGLLLRRWRHRDARTRIAPLVARAQPGGLTHAADRDLVEAALRAYLRRRVPIRWVASPGEVLRLDGASAERARPITPVALWALSLPPGTAVADGQPDARVAQARAWLDQREASVEDDADDAAGDGGDEADELRRALAEAGPAHDALLGILRGAAGPFVVTGSGIAISERPIALHLDAQGRLHAEGGPAIAWADGLAVHAWHGTTVPAWVIEDPDRITADTIDAERNIEVRRVLLERYGAARYLQAGGATLVHEGATGRLWRKPLGGEPSWHRWRASQRSGNGPDEVLLMVEVRNSTPEPDGTHRTYFLRVPPGMRTAREAVAWTFGLTGPEYAPSVET
jgi:hypothetical protein